MKKSKQFVLRRKSDGWYVSPGSKHTSDPLNAISLDETEVREWLQVWGNGYEAVDAKTAKEVE